jgi:hypothetical protein
MFDSKQYRRIVRASAWYDLLATIGFATPWSFAAVHASLLWLVDKWQLAGAFPAFAPAHVLMVNLLGSVVTVWALLRIRDPQQQFGRYDAAARFLFATWQIYAVAHGASTIILAFTAMEIVFGILQSMPVRAEVGGVRSTVAVA